VRCACVLSCVVFRLFCNDFALVSRVRLITWSECALFLLSPGYCCGFLRIFPLCVYGSGVFVVFGGCVTTVMFLIVVLRVRIGTHRATIKLALQVSETINRT